MNSVILCPSDEGFTNIINPNPTCGIPLEEIAKKDVPAGRPYIIVDRDELPKNTLLFEAWKVEYPPDCNVGLGPVAWWESLLSMNDNWIVEFAKANGATDVVDWIKLNVQRSKM